VVLVRHGETEWSRDGRHTGRTDIALTDRGRALARRLAAELQNWSFSLVLTSPLKRAEETARLAGFGDQAQARPDLMEWNYGRYEGQTSAQIKAARPDWSLWRDGCPDGENAADVGHRVDRVIDELRRAGGDALLFAHGHVLRVLAARWLGQPPADGRLYALDTAALSILGYEHDDSVIRRWNQPPR
jgi:probable phosphoglycerate mutase